MLLGSHTCYSDILSVAKAKGNDMGNNMGDMGNGMEGIYCQGLYIVDIVRHDNDILCSPTSVGAARLFYTHTVLLTLLF